MGFTYKLIKLNSYDTILKNMYICSCSHLTLFCLRMTLTHKNRLYTNKQVNKFKLIDIIERISASTIHHIRGELFLLRWSVYIVFFALDHFLLSFLLFCTQNMLYLLKYLTFHTFPSLFYLYYLFYDELFRCLPQFSIPSYFHLLIELILLTLLKNWKHFGID